MFIVEASHAPDVDAIVPSSSRAVSVEDAGTRSAHIGRLAQLVARFLHTEEVISSSLVSPTSEALANVMRSLRYLVFVSSYASSPCTTVSMPASSSSLLMRNPIVFSMMKPIT